jgi:hypothetical protein
VISSLILALFSAAILFGLAVLFRRWGVPENRFIVVSFLFLGVVLGLASAFLWPQDLGVYLNVFGASAGDWIYRTSIQLVGDPNSGQAHYTIPWMARVPQVYAWISPVLYGIIGGLTQTGFDRLRKKPSPSRAGNSGSG